MNYRVVKYERGQVQTLRRELAKPVRRIHTIFGPRQSGKTTIVLQALRGIDTVSLYRAVEDPSLERQGGFGSPHWVSASPGRKDQAWLIRVWEEARREAATHGRAVLAFDEIQKVENWSETVKGLWDADRREGCPLHVVILGSAPMSMQSGVAESLAGRFQHIPVAHWSFREMADAFGLSLAEYAFYGGYPGVSDLIAEPSEWRKHVRSAFIETTIERDVVGVARIEKPALLNCSSWVQRTPDRFWRSRRSSACSRALATQRRSSTTSSSCPGSASWRLFPDTRPVRHGSAPTVRSCLCSTRA